jgi:tetratricopeptide (TPR) repeat protein
MLRDYFRMKEIYDNAQLVTASIIKDYPLSIDAKIITGSKNRKLAEKKIDYASTKWNVLVTDIQKNMNIGFFGKARFCKRVQSNLLDLGYSMDATVYIIEKLLASLTRKHQSQTDKPDYAEAYFNLGCMLLDQNHRKEALESFNRALALRPGYPEVQKKLRECS